MLGLVCDEPGHSTATYADLIDVSNPVITRAKATLAGLGLLTCRADPTDARRLKIEPTPSGAALRRSVQDLPAEAIKEAAAEWNKGIETAPDGEEDFILVYCPQKPCPFVFNGKILHQMLRPGQPDHLSMRGYTHWRQLPAPPKP